MLHDPGFCIIITVSSSVWIVKQAGSAQLALDIALASTLRTLTHQVFGEMTRTLVRPARCGCKYAVGVMPTKLGCMKVPARACAHGMASTSCDANILYKG